MEHKEASSLKFKVQELQLVLEKLLSSTVSTEFHFPQKDSVATPIDFNNSNKEGQGEGEGHEQLILHVLVSPSSKYRYRCRFQLLHDGEENDKVSFAVWEKGSPVALASPSDFPIAAEVIQQYMEKVLQTLNETEAGDTDNVGDGGASISVLKNHCNAVHFHSTVSGDNLIVFIYGQPVEDERLWMASVNILKEVWGCQNIMARYKGKSLVVGDPYVEEILHPRGHASSITLQQPEGAFSNPNPYICERTMEWLVFVLNRIKQQSSNNTQVNINVNNDDETSQELTNPTEHHLNILELYSGAGTYTPLLSQYSDHITSIEINHNLVWAARTNMELNDIHGASVRLVQAPVEKCKHILKHGNHDGVSFNCVMLDPPRGGMDAFTRSCLHQYDHIILLSCAPLHTYPNDLPTLLKTHRVVCASMLDHFPMTTHMEAGLYLQRKHLEE